MKTSSKRSHYFDRDELPQIELDSTNIDGKRYYWTPDGALYPSVTTVLGDNPEKKDGLKRWKDKIGHDEANRITKRAAGRGTELHTICEDYLLNKDSFLSSKMPLSIELFKNIQPILDEHVELIYGNELALFSHKLQTAGRTDMFCRFMGTNTIVDFKTSTKDKKEVWIEDYFLQSTAYAIMLEEVYKDLKPIYIPQIAIVVAVEEGEQKAQLFVKKTIEYRNEVYSRFQNYASLNPPPRGVRTFNLFENIE